MCVLVSEEIVSQWRQSKAGKSRKTAKDKVIDPWSGGENWNQERSNFGYGRWQQIITGESCKTVEGEV